MTGTTTTLHSSAAEAFVAAAPTASLLRAVPLDPAAASGLAVSEAIVTSFVGTVSADTALVLHDLDAVAAAAGPVSSAVSVLDVLRPALEAATAVLGSGVLGDSRVERVDALLADPSTVAFELVGPAGSEGWFAVRVRRDGTIGGLGTTAPAVAPAVPTVLGAAGAASAAGSVVTGVQPSAATGMGNLGRIHGVEMALTVEIGRTRMSVRDVLDLEPGAVVELDRPAGDPADVLLNGRLIAQGEVVVVDQDYAVRITRILDVAEGI